jgi:5-methylcytosine-specific restriction endonuclease McrA
MPGKPPASKRRAAPTASNKAASQARYDRARGSATARGYGATWQRVRLSVLQDEPLCRFCKDAGKITPAQEVDHIDGNSRNNDRSNLRPLCKPCHTRRTVRDQGQGKMQWRPEWLRPSRIPLTIVCGPPASGKSTYVKEHAGKYDLVIDLDEIASSLSGQSLHDWDRSKWLVPAMRRRNEILGDLSRATTARWPRAWLIVSEAKPEYRQWWDDTLKPERIIVIETQPDECMRRVRADSTRPRDKTNAAITAWWSNYQRREGDEVVRG